MRSFHGAPVAGVPRILSFLLVRCHRNTWKADRCDLTSKAWEVRKGPWPGSATAGLGDPGQGGTLGTLVSPSVQWG